MRVITTLNKVLGKDYADVSEACLELIKPEYLKKAYHDEVYFTNIAQRITGKDYGKLADNLANLKYEFYESLPKTVYGIQLKKNILTTGAFDFNMLLDNKIGVVTLLNYVLYFKDDTNIEDFSCRLTRAVTRLDDNSKLLNKFITTYIITDKAKELVDNINQDNLIFTLNIQGVTRDFDLREFGITGNHFFYGIILGLINTFQPHTLKSKTLTDKTINRFTSILRYSDTKEQIETIIQKYKTEGNTDANNKYTSEYITSLTEELDNTKLQFKGITEKAIIRNEYQDKLLDYLVIAIDSNNLYMINKVSLLIHQLGFTLKFKGNTVKLA